MNYLSKRRISLVLVLSFFIIVIFKIVLLLLCSRIREQPSHSVPMSKEDDVQHRKMGLKCLRHPA